MRYKIFNFFKPLEQEFTKSITQFILCLEYYFDYFQITVCFVYLMSTRKNDL